MVLGVPLFPMLALGGYLGYKVWPYLSESKREIPKNVALDTAGFFMDGDFLVKSVITVLSATTALFIVGIAAYAVKVLLTGESGFWPTLAKFVITEALIIGLSLGMQHLAYVLYDDEPYRFVGGREDVGERFSVTTFVLSNLVFLPIAASKLAVEATDNRKTATATGILTLTISAVLAGAYLQYEFVQ